MDKIPFTHYFKILYLRTGKVSESWKGDCEHCQENFEFSTLGLTLTCNMQSMLAVARVEIRFPIKIIFGGTFDIICMLDKLTNACI